MKINCSINDDNKSVFEDQNLFGFFFQVDTNKYSKHTIECLTLYIRHKQTKQLCITNTLIRFIFLAKLSEISLCSVTNVGSTPIHRRLIIVEREHVLRVWIHQQQQRFTDNKVLYEDNFCLHTSLNKSSMEMCKSQRQQLQNHLNFSSELNRS